MKFNITKKGLRISTIGFALKGGREIGAEIEDISLADECRDFLRYVAAYIETGNLIRPGETFAYGYWITKLVENDGGELYFWEYSHDFDEYVPGISNTLRFWRDQHQVCDSSSSVFSPPNAAQMIVISEGVIEGDDVQGVRYPSPMPMSGWWITTDRYNGNVSSLKPIHAHHLTRARPDLIKFLALSFGFRFYSDNGEVRFESKILDDGKS